MKIDNVKPTLIPAEVPWSVATSAPYLQLHDPDNCSLAVLTFIGYFKLNGGGHDSSVSSVEIVSDPGQFLTNSDAENAEYKLVRITFKGKILTRVSAAFSDHEVLPESEFDWTRVPGALRTDEDVIENMDRTNQYWHETETSPDPGFYQVHNSHWISELDLSDTGLNHYIVVGQDEYIEVLASGWEWEGGQPA